MKIEALLHIALSTSGIRVVRTGRVRICQVDLFLTENIASIWEELLEHPYLEVHTLQFSDDTHKSMVENILEI
jgi:hypothetical protein